MISERNSLWSCFSVVLLILFIALISCRASSSGPKNIVLITIDTLRADRLGVYGSHVLTPSIDSLAGEGVLFERAYCQVPVTLPSHVTILTGTYPFSHGVRHNGKFRLTPEALTLAEIMKSRGYQTAAFLGAYVLDAKYGLSQGFDLYDDRMPGEKYNGVSMYTSRRASEITSSAERWLEQVEEPFFAWIHYFDPHGPYEPPEPFMSQYSNPYDGEVAYVDSEIGKLLAGVSKKGLAGNTLVVLTSDHGESLGEHGELSHAIFLYSSTTWVPLIISLPGEIPPGSRDNSVVQLVDVVPTILSLLGMETPRECEGRDLFSSDADGFDLSSSIAYSETWAPRLQYGWSELYCIRDERYLYVEAPGPELYDLTVDPAEQVNIYNTIPEVADVFSSLVDSLRNSAVFTTASEDLELAAADREALENLGYIFETEVSSSGAGEDPKDMIMLHRDILRAFSLLSEGLHVKAFEILEAALARDGDDPVINRGVGLCYQLMGKDSLALLHLKRAILLDPREERSYYNASGVLRRMGRFNEAAEILETLVRRYPSDPLAWLELARARSMTGSSEKTLEAYRTAARLDPDDYRLHRDIGRFLLKNARYGEALLSLEEAVRLEEDVPAIWVDVGWVLRQLGREEEARRAFETALSLDPEFGPAKKSLAGEH